MTSWAATYAAAQALDALFGATFVRFKGRLGGAGGVHVTQIANEAGPYDLDPETTPDGSERYGVARDLVVHYRLDL